ncbi:hypothetical protein PAXINDRAFT_31848, partial [Paxillus involutus ATCC 200175]
LRVSRVGFVPEDDELSFGFVDPSDVVRGIHLIPAFAYGRTPALLSGPLVARATSGEQGKHDDWRLYYVNQFVDHDMYMRFLGGGVGH